MYTVQEHIRDGYIDIQFNGCGPIAYNKNERDCIEEIVGTYDQRRRRAHQSKSALGGRINKQIKSEHRHVRIPFMPVRLRDKNHVVDMFENEAVTVGSFMQKLKDNNKTEPSLQKSEACDWTVLVYVGGDYFQMVDRDYLFADIPNQCIRDLVIITDRNTIDWKNGGILGDVLLPGQHVIFENRILHMFNQAVPAPTTMDELNTNWNNWFYSTVYGKWERASVDTPHRYPDAQSYLQELNDTRRADDVHRHGKDAASSYSSVHTENDSRYTHDTRSSSAARASARDAHDNMSDRDGRAFARDVLREDQNKLDAKKEAERLRGIASDKRVDDKRQEEMNIKIAEDIRIENIQRANWQEIENLKSHGYLAQSLRDKVATREPITYSLYTNINMPMTSTMAELKKRCLTILRTGGHTDRLKTEDYERGITLELLNDTTKEVIRTMKILSNPALRSDYDRYGDYIRFNDNLHNNMRFDTQLSYNPYIL